MEELIEIEEDRIFELCVSLFNEKNYQELCFWYELLNGRRVAFGKEQYGIHDFIILIIMHALHEKKDNPNSAKSVYCIDFDGVTKIGVSETPEIRAKTLSYQSGREIKRMVYTEEIKNPFEIESKLHKLFSKKRIKGEYFSDCFEEVIDYFNKQNIDIYDFDFSETLGKRNV